MAVAVSTIPEREKLPAFVHLRKRAELPFLGLQIMPTSRAAHAIHIRDSKDTGGPALSVSAGAWAAFLAEVTA
ncbi:DUF397 domain-containing protein [Streptomyces sp. NPDC001339]|uniref:DUF397 domain-containing protein n=1 Tax=Streptomyces sp. NPDC001339 TaxID=3364563 RepID=UPI0036BF13C7